ncbi:MAG: T9SS type A sorting domain-containing protein [Chlorobi bacterium]|nr:T9SS type A sorting domain-containing protein [Chlorobiota bacterium]
MKKIKHIGMWKFLRSGVVLFIAFYINAQNPVISVQEDTVRMETTVDEREVVMYNQIINQTGKMLTLNWKVLKQDLPEEWDITVCFGNTCSSDPQTGGTLILESGDRMDVSVFISKPHNAPIDSASIELIVYDPGDSSATVRTMVFKAVPVEITHISVGEMGAISDDFRIVSHAGMLSFINYSSMLYDITVYDILGNAVWNGTVEKQSRLNIVHSFPPGIYWIQLKNEAGEVRTLTMRLD